MNYKTELESLIEIVVKERGSDIHLSAGSYPTVRVDSVLIPLTQKSRLSAEDTQGILMQMLNEDQQKRFVEEHEIDFSYQHKPKVRFRGNGYIQQGTVSIALRLIAHEIKSLQELGLPPILETFTELQQGFFLVVGPVGQGKSTTLAAMVELINQNRAEHIVTIEDPIEYLFEPKRSLIDQREIRVDTKDFPTALSAAFRQDMDVIMLGEMREPETISTAVTAAETGHLVLSTLHTNNAAQTVDRILDSFPSEQQEQIRSQLAGSLTGILSQRLVPRISGGLLPTFELLVNNNAVANLIREKRSHEINTVIETGSADGMIDMNRTLADLVRKGEITPESALSRATNPKAFQRLI